MARKHSRGGMPRYFAVVLFTMLAAPHSFAFESWEHDLLGQMSLLVSSNYCNGKYRGNETNRNEMEKMNRILGEFGSGLRNVKGEASKVTYGKIDMLVDYMKDPEEMYPHDRTTPEDEKTGSPQARSWPTDGASCNLPYLETLADDDLSMYNATHEDQNHFQWWALFSYRLWHLQAVETARAGNLWGALLASAYADHFLQDFFAPGHLLSPRDNRASDIYSLMLHDEYNSSGMWYIVGSGGDLLELVSSELSMVEGNKLTVTVRDAEGKHPYSADLDAGSLLELLSHAKNESQPEEVLCYGDGELKKNPQQVPLMVTYCARSIADVLESYLLRRQINHFPTFHWEQGFFKGAFGLLDMTEALDVGLPYGDLKCRREPRNFEVRKLKKSRYATIQNDITNESKLHYDVTAGFDGAAARNPPVAVSLGMQTFSDSSESHVRGLFDVDMMVLGFRRDYMRSAYSSAGIVPNQFALTLGYSGVADRNEQAHGMQGRFIVPLPQVNLDLSLGIGARYFFGDNSGGWGDFQTLRLAWGMQVAELFFAVGHDQYAEPNHGLKDGLSFEAGVSIAFPVSRWWSLMPWHTIHDRP